MGQCRKREFLRKNADQDSTTQMVDHKGLWKTVAPMWLSTKLAGSVFNTWQNGKFLHSRLYNPVVINRCHVCIPVNLRSNFNSQTLLYTLRNNFEQRIKYVYICVYIYIKFRSRACMFNFYYISEMEMK